MQLSHSRPVASAIFDDPNLVSCAGLVPMVALAQQCDLAAVADEHLRLPTDKGANAGAKVTSLVAGMVAGADSIDACVGRSPTYRHGRLPAPPRALQVGKRHAHDGIRCGRRVPGLSDRKILRQDTQVGSLILGGCRWVRRWSTWARCSAVRMGCFVIRRPLVGRRLRGRARSWPVRGDLVRCPTVAFALPGPNGLRDWAFPV